MIYFVSRNVVCVGQNIKFCPRELKGLRGDCLHSLSDCETEFNSRFKGAQARRCRCDTTSSYTHSCSCCIVCGLEDKNIGFLNHVDFLPQC
jgi:hypothetical protein